MSLSRRDAPWSGLLPAGDCSALAADRTHCAAGLDEVRNTVPDRLRECYCSRPRGRCFARPSGALGGGQEAWCWPTRTADAVHAPGVAEAGAIAIVSGCATANEPVPQTTGRPLRERSQPSGAPRPVPASVSPSDSFTPSPSSETTMAPVSPRPRRTDKRDLAGATCSPSRTRSSLSSPVCGRPESRRAAAVGGQGVLPPASPL